MYSLSSLVILCAFLPFTTLASPHVPRQSLHSRINDPIALRNATAQGRRSTQYTLQDKYSGNDFINDWNFFDSADPTNGYVNYLTKSEAQSNGLAYVQKDGTAILAVDNYTKLSAGAKRNSVRISSPKTYNGGLFIADFYAMPHGCTVWPAWWTVGPNWPAGGEIDIIEGVNQGTTNQLTVHSSSGCQITENVGYTGSVTNLNCDSSGSSNAGCGFSDPDSRSYGHGFNDIAGGVYAVEWTNDGIKGWFFPRGEIPSDITSSQPDPSSWGTPVAFWSSDSCDISQHFYSHSLTLDTTLCGDWAGAAFSATCSGSCADAVADPSNFDFAKWEINYIAVYQS